MDVDLFAQHADHRTVRVGEEDRSPWTFLGSQITYFPVYICLINYIVFHLANLKEFLFLVLGINIANEDTRLSLLADNMIQKPESPENQINLKLL